MAAPGLSKLAACCFTGDPRSRRTWSGTPANFCAELERRGRLGATFDSGAYAPPPLRMLGRAASKAFYGWSRYVRYGAVERPWAAREVARQMDRSSEEMLLHFTCSDMPAEPGSRAVKHLIFCDSTWELYTRAATDRARIDRRLWRDAERLDERSYAQAAHIFTVAEYVRENLHARYQVPLARITAIGTGTGIIKPYFGPKDYTKPTLLFVAKERFEDKGGTLLLQAFARLLAQMPEARLVLVGDEKWAQHVGRIPRVEVHGFIPLPDLQRLFEEAALFVLPGYNEPWGLVYLEAMSCQTPVLGLRRNAIPELTRHGEFGFSLAEPDAGALADLLFEALSDPERLRRMGQAAQAYVLAEMTWEKAVERMLAVCDRLG